MNSQDVDKLTFHSQYEYTFTIFTPTYDRGHTLYRVYRSLKAQTFRDFEWLIVDDGSTDNTQTLVREWEKEADFPIRYIWQENQGKHVAINRGVENAKGKLFLIFDSDDACVPEALERFKCHWDLISDNKKEQFTGVTALCVDQYDKLVGNKFPKDITDSDSLKIRYKFKIRGEKWGFHRTDVLQKYPFPQTVRRQYLPEGLIWSKIARKYKTRFINELLRIYYIDQPSLVHGQSPAKNAVGGQINKLSVLNDEIDYFKYAPLEFCRSALHYVRFSFHNGTKVLAQAEKLDNLMAKVLWAMFLPFGFFVYLWDRIYYKPSKLPLKF